jgi:threonine synthase
LGSRVWSFAPLNKGGWGDFNFCVPSANLGNLTGGLFATLVGQQVNKFIVAHNANHFFPDFLSGKVEAFEFHPTIATVSNAMDVGSPSNFERLYSLFGAERLRTWMWSTTVSDEVTLERMKKTYDVYGYIACPHTSVGLEALERYRVQTGDNKPIITLACAHPAKFPEAVSKALGITPPTEETLEQLLHGETNVKLIEPEVLALKNELL